MGNMLIQSILIGYIVLVIYLVLINKVRKMDILGVAIVLVLYVFYRDIYIYSLYTKGLDEKLSSLTDIQTQQEDENRWVNSLQDGIDRHPEYYIFNERENPLL